MTRHLATLRSTDKLKLASMLVPPNRITHGLAINQGLDCTLSQHKVCTKCQPTPFQSLRGEGVLYAVLHPLRIGPGSELITIGAGY